MYAKGRRLSRVATAGAQVLLACDDSRSMAENGCGGFALESLALICKAMSRCAGWQGVKRQPRSEPPCMARRTVTGRSVALVACRLEVGQVGVIKFGGAQVRLQRHAQPMHRHCPSLLRHAAGSVRLVRVWASADRLAWHLQD
jgi:hypothetical protein